MISGIALIRALEPPWNQNVRCLYLCGRFGPLSSVAMPMFVVDLGLCLPGERLPVPQPAY